MAKTFSGAALIDSLLLLTVAVAQDRTKELKHVMALPQNGSRPVALSAISIEREGLYPSVIRLKGNVEIKTPVCVQARQGSETVCDGSVILTADEAEFHEDTGAIESRGKVTVTPVHQRP